MSQDVMDGTPEATTPVKAHEDHAMSDMVSSSCYADTAGCRWSSFRSTYHAILFKIASNFHENAMEFFPLQKIHIFSIK